LIEIGMPLQHRHALWTAWVGRRQMENLSELREKASVEDSRQIDLDIPRTHPDMLRKPQQDLLTRVLYAFAGCNPDVGYCQGMNFIAMVFVILGFSEPVCFAGLCHITETICPKYHGPDLEGYIKDAAVLGVLVHHLLPDIHRQLDTLDIPLTTIALDHFISLSARNLPLGAVARIWDLILANGTPALIATFLAFLELYFLRAVGVGFEVLQEKDAFAGKNAHQMPASDLEACKRLCIDRSYGAFVVYRGTAYFRQQAAQQCRCNLTAAPGSCLYLSHAHEASEGESAVPAEPAEAMERFKVLLQSGAEQELDRLLGRARHWLQVVPVATLEQIRAEITASEDGLFAFSGGPSSKTSTAGTAGYDAG